MTEFLLLLYWVVEIYTLMLVGRILIEVIHAFSRNFRAPRWFVIIAEFLFVLTDPPVKFLRKLIPPMRLGNVALDVSILVLFFALQVFQIVLGVMMHS
ncbi:YggT family protein [Corynebacterium sp. sy017]|uniref:YggT family protein n=1 Tax=unclassified Corynebacterium TaxID=2624378 RepID=UPI0011869C9C|nr:MULTISPECIES: YggT family protein [unclassified Corynebacterium]MBP3087953.1 YggT family protein [Corynebacterium sp. sy017]QDZ42913.1 YggT family protein [Corynebacterium sp. sy039]TSD92487.1 YggT family protein [Corynebacterium sp. SY003]